MLINCHSRTELPKLYPWELFISSIHFFTGILIHVFIWWSCIVWSWKYCSNSYFLYSLRVTQRQGWRTLGEAIWSPEAVCIAFKNCSPGLVSENGGNQKTEASFRSTGLIFLGLRFFVCEKFHSLISVKHWKAFGGKAH